MLNLDDLRALFVGLCAHFRDNPPPWPGIGHTWTSAVMRYFCRTVPHGCEAWFEVPVRMPEHSHPKRLDLVWASAYPESAENELVLALETEQGAWADRSDDAWWECAEDELNKVLRANTAAGVLVLSRDRSTCEPDHEYLDRATARIDKALNGRRTGKWLLVVLLTPPLKNGLGHCTAHGFIYDANGANHELGSVDCWKEI